MRKQIILTLSIILLMNISLFSQNTKKKILIAYGSFSGSTKEIVDSMETHLTNNSFKVDILSAEKNKIDLSEYDFILIGSAIHGNAPHPKILEFIDINRVELNSKEIAVFVVCGTITSSKKSKRENALTYPNKVAYGLKSIDEVVFAGNMPSNGKKFEDFMCKLFLGFVPGDYRNWGKIKEWTIETVSNN